MLLTKEVSVKVANNKEYYKRLGYDVGERIDKYGRLSIPKNQVVLVKVSELSSGSRAAVEVLCDYCCQEIKKVPYKTYLKGREIVDKDCCIKCLHFKYTQNILWVLGCTPTSSYRIFLDIKKSLNGTE